MMTEYGSIRPIFGFKEDTVPKDHYDNFFEAWCFLEDHKMFEDIWGHSHFQECLSIDIRVPPPIGDEIGNDENLKDKVYIWLEVGEYVTEPDNDPDGDLVYTHDELLDSAGDTFEKAIICLANLVNKYYPPEDPEDLLEDSEDYLEDLENGYID